MRENRHRPSNNSYDDSYSSERTREGSPVSSELVKKEQDYRHQWQDKYLKSNISSFRLGQVFGLIYNLALLWVIYDLIQDGEKSLALKLFVGNLAIIAFALLVTSIERKFLTRKPPRKSVRGGRFHKDRNDRNRNDHNRKRENSR